MSEALEDLCWKEGSFYFDVVSNVNGTWTAYFNNNRLEEGFPTREAAKEWLDNPDVRREHGIVAKRKARNAPSHKAQQD